MAFWQSGLTALDHATHSRRSTELHVEAAVSAGRADPCTKTAGDHGSEGGGLGPGRKAGSSLPRYSTSPPVSALSSRCSRTGRSTL